jgi:phenylacetate-CoA ligase
MFQDLFERPLNQDAYSDRPFTFVSKTAHNDLGNIAAINLIENGDRLARETWQNHQLTNLLRHAQAKSTFWRERMPSRVISHTMFKFLPVLSREDITRQVSREGSLAVEQGAASRSIYASTGSTGVPVQVHATPQNGYYNDLRGLAQYFFDGLSLVPNHTKIGPALKLEKMDRKSIAVRTSASWAGPVAEVFRSGSAKLIHFYHDEQGLIDELSKGEVGYLASPSRYVEILLKRGGPELIRKLGIKLWQHSSDHRDPEVVAALTSVGVPSLSIYSAAEIGPIAFECCRCPGYFHVAHSNVIVECDEETSVEFDGATVGRLLVTHLHSYATPIIRYDVGDFGRLHQKCECGHDGPAVSHIYGRGKHFLRHPDGRLMPFYISTRVLLEAMHFSECRFRQPAQDMIVMEIGGRESLSAEEETKLRQLVTNATDPAFKIEIRPVAEINWGDSPKRLFFSSAVA